MNRQSVGVWQVAARRPSRYPIALAGFLVVTILTIGPRIAPAQEDPLATARRDALLEAGAYIASMEFGHSLPATDREVSTAAEATLGLAQSGFATEGQLSRLAVILLNHEPRSLDTRARVLRALAYASYGDPRGAEDLASLVNVNGPVGWGATSGQRSAALDSALVLGAISATGVAVPEESTILGEIFSLRYAGQGWGSDGLESDRFVTAEILRALSDLDIVDSSQQIALLDALDYLKTDTPNGQVVDASTPTILIAARLAALHSHSQTDSQLEAELSGRISFGPSSPPWAGGAMVNELGLLALATYPLAPVVPALPGDLDGDGVLDDVDAAPFDAVAYLDSDRDGIADVYDADRDGDGIANGSDDRPDDPTEVLDSDGDGIGNRIDSNDDLDQLSDLQELELGTDPLLRDTDLDGIDDDLDSCPLIAVSVDPDRGNDQDLDGICTPLDGCDDWHDPLDYIDLDGDGDCTAEDLDDDGDGWPDEVELAIGTDPLSALSYPAAPLDPNEDFDGDGLMNSQEVFGDSNSSNPYLADSDADGVWDWEERAVGADPLDPSQQPAGALAAFGSAGGCATAEAGMPGVDCSGGYRQGASFGQPTPIASGAASEIPGALGGVYINYSGLQAQRLGSDGDGDGLAWIEEDPLGGLDSLVDTDADGFVDGSDGIVSWTSVMDGWDLDADGFVDGELDFATSVVDPTSRPGRPGDVAPLGFPDGVLTVADLLVLMRVVDDPGLPGTLADPSNGNQNQSILENAADASEDGRVDAADILVLINEIQE